MENNNLPLEERIKCKDTGDLLTFASHIEEPDFKPVCIQHALRQEPRSRAALMGHCCFLVLPKGSLWCWPQADATSQRPLRAQGSPSSHQSLPRSSEDRLSGESRVLGCALPSAQTSRSLQQQPQRCQLESKRLSQDVAHSSWVPQLCGAEQSEGGPGLARARALTVTHILGQ